jgi:Mn2+/Fe2+ NRAMP family transporter
MEGYFDLKLPIWKRVFITRMIAITPALAVCFVEDFSDALNYINIL